MAESMLGGANRAFSMMIPLMMRKKQDEQDLMMKQQMLDMKRDELRQEATEKGAELKRKTDETKTKYLTEMYKSAVEKGDPNLAQQFGSQLSSMGMPVATQQPAGLPTAQGMIPPLKYLVNKQEEKPFTSLEQLISNMPGKSVDEKIALYKQTKASNPNFKTFYDKDGKPNTIDTTKQTPDPTWSDDKPDKKPSTAMAKYIQDNPNATADDIAGYSQKLKGPQETPEQKDAKKTLTRLEDDIMQITSKVEGMRAGVDILTETMKPERLTAIQNLETQLNTMKTQYSELGGKRKFGAEQKAEPMPEMPAAAEHKDKIIKDTETGKRYKSDGKEWKEIK